jgi:threonyl-tRNA synthetase
MAKKLTPSNIENVRHSLSHLLAAAVLKKFPEAKLGIGPVIENGFYYDFLLPRTLTPDDLKDFEKTMRDFIAKKLPFSGKKIAPSGAKKLFRDQPFKLELIKEYTNPPPGIKKRPLSIYKTGDVFVDLCAGGHVKNTEEINPEAFRLDKIAGAYWRGDEKNPQLQRIYGLAFENKKQLNEFLKLREEAERRDHKKLGAQLDLFTFSELVGSGLPLWTQRGTLIRDLLDNFVWELREKQGYERVDIPHLAKKELYEKSGHWEKFKDDLFKIETREGHFFVVKPMNCPHHIQIFQRKSWSYRDMPQRYASTTKVYRDEQSGELAGLFRVRSITQDDAHVFCRQSQIKEEFVKIWDIVHEFYGAFGFSLRVRLSLHDPKHPEKYLGTPKQWKTAEGILRQIAKEKKADAFEAPGEANFYGPKLDFMAKDSLGREHQVATIQLDMNMPDRFDLVCVGKNGKPERLAMIHAAIMGSIERFIGVAIEHFAGAFPLWLSPTQAEVINVGSGQRKYAAEVYKKLKAAGIRTNLSNENLTVGKRIRDAEIMKVPYILVVGEKEQKNGTVNIRHYRRGQEGEIKTEKLLVKISDEINNKVI